MSYTKLGGENYQAATSSCLQGFNTKWTEEGTNNWVYAFALFFGGLIQLLAGMWGEAPTRHLHTKLIVAFPSCLPDL